MKNHLIILLLLSVSMIVMSCQRNDDEPIENKRSISRLYISTSNYEEDGGNSFYNIYVIEPADSSSFPPKSFESIYKYKSSAKGGAFLFYSPYNGGKLFQGSQNLVNAVDTSISVMKVGEKGTLEYNNLVSYRGLNQVRGISYVFQNGEKVSGDYLLALNGNDVADSLLVFNNSVNNAKNRRPKYYLPLDYNSWGINADGSNLVVSSFTSASTITTKPNAFNGLVVYKNLLNQLTPATRDTLLTDVGRYNLTIEGANTIRGIAYSKSLDLLVVTDYDRNGTASVGRILFFENFYEKYNSSQNISPDRIVTSANKLKSPFDIAIDGRKEGKYIYVADTESRAVFRYNISDKGEVNPDKEFIINGRTPFALSLDAR